MTGNCLLIRRGNDELEVVVETLSDRRQSASIAQQLYQETTESVTRRALRARERAEHAQRVRRPDKKSRRQLTELKRRNGAF